MTPAQTTISPRANGARRVRQCDMAAGAGGLRPAVHPAASRATTPLRPCRFCGSSAATCGEVATAGGELRWTVICLNKRCHAHGPTRTTPAAARRAWNEDASTRAMRLQWEHVERNPWP